MLLTPEQMTRAEITAFVQGVEAGQLMEQAGLGVAEIVRQFHPVAGTCVVFCGKGNNAGDAMVAGRHLAGWGWKVHLQLTCGPEEFSELAMKNFEALDPLLSTGSRVSARPLVVIDGLLGIGAHGAPRGKIADSIHLLNRIREREGAWVLAVDIPSGMDGHTGIPSETCVRADCTATIAYAKTGLIADDAADFVGRLAVVPLRELESTEGDPASVAAAASLRGFLPQRSFDKHKGLCGRVGVLAGSPGFTGAARLCSEAVVRAGAGLVTLFAQEDVYPILAACATPEVMVRSTASLRDVMKERFDALAIGPGLGRDRDAEVLEILETVNCPCVVDADALNALDRRMDILKSPPGPRLLTPHPGEMERLDPRRGRSRRQWLQDFVNEYPVTLLLKGSRTIIGEQGHPVVFNTTGNPGMASGGMGDVLSGVCAALLGQGKTPYEAAMLGAWLCGRSAERAVFGPGGSPESLSAHDVIAHLGAAFISLRAEDF